MLLISGEFLFCRKYSLSYFNYTYEIHWTDFSSQTTDVLKKSFMLQINKINKQLILRWMLELKKKLLQNSFRKPMSAAWCDNSQDAWFLLRKAFSINFVLQWSVWSFRRFINRYMFWLNSSRLFHPQRILVDISLDMAVKRQNHPHPKYDW